ncbi:hypothetical protein M9H77_00904 [Catharanthus roseus]|uniref:Uncharacterized protein n=1 Tax=Catharanthus roseus TaxID=4058 RepID=A0ACC0C4A7_CATRO|nr:hypothetical protein M9H77_00904 [Catharanthus roseus]
MDPNSLGAGYMAVFAVSGSVVLVALQVHKRLLSNFMKKMEFEIGSPKNKPKKKVRFADEVAAATARKPVPPASENKGHHMKKQNHHHHHCRVPKEEKLEAMPLNWQALYKGIIQYRALRSLD